uniref:Uncharacterized protein n=1 Tax=Anguilla anguilla TaxID=7936 RepID=A0A0E9PPF1_ANGAN
MHCKFFFFSLKNQFSFSYMVCCFYSLILCIQSYSHEKYY